MFLEVPHIAYTTVIVRLSSSLCNMFYKCKPWVRLDLQNVKISQGAEFIEVKQTQNVNVNWKEKKKTRQVSKENVAIVNHLQLHLGTSKKKKKKKES